MYKTIRIIILTTITLAMAKGAISFTNHVVPAENAIRWYIYMLFFGIIGSIVTAISILYPSEP